MATRAKAVYRLGVSFAALGGGALALALALAARDVELAVPQPAELLAACRRLLPDPGLQGLLLVSLAGLSTIVTWRAARSLARNVRTHRRLVATLDRVGHAETTGARVTLFADDEPRAFCAGYLKPRIYLSTGALQRLSRVEMRAVVAHERFHCSRRDPLRILLLRTLAAAFFFLPAVGPFAERYESAAELAADEAAIRAGSRSALASALLAFGETHDPAVVVGIAPERVSHLRGRPPAFHPPASTLLLSTVALAVGLVVVAVAGAAPAGSLISLPLALARGCMLAMVGVAGLGLAAPLLRRPPRFGAR